MQSVEIVERASYSRPHPIPTSVVLVVAPVLAPTLALAVAPVVDPVVAPVVIFIFIPTCQCFSYLCEYLIIGLKNMPKFIQGRILVPTRWRRLTSTNNISLVNAGEFP